jgi:hypothetical protein
MSEDRSIKSTCFLCQKPLEGKRYSLDEYLDIEEKADSVGMTCNSCGTAICDDHRKELNFKWHSGYSKSLCPQCGRSLKSFLYIIPAVKEKPPQIAIEAKHTQKQKEMVVPENFHDKGRCGVCNELLQKAANEFTFFSGIHEATSTVQEGVARVTKYRVYGFEKHIFGICTKCKKRDLRELLIKAAAILTFAAYLYFALTIERTNIVNPLVDAVMFVFFFGGMVGSIAILESNYKLLKNKVRSYRSQTHRSEWVRVWNDDEFKDYFREEFPQTKLKLVSK